MLINFSANAIPDKLTFLQLLMALAVLRQTYWNWRNACLPQGVKIMKSSLIILLCLRVSLLQVYILDKSGHSSSKFRVSEHSPLSDSSDACHGNSSLWKLQSTADQLLINLAWNCGDESISHTVIYNLPQSEETKECRKNTPERHHDVSNK